MSKSKIIVCYHKEFNIYKNECLLPIHVGKSLNPNILTDIIGDNTGDNISHKNKTYCELTGLYWLWKNYDVDYYGIFHYRRFLNIDNLHLDKINAKQMNINSFNSSLIEDLMFENNIIVPTKTKFHYNLYRQYTSSHHEKDLVLTLDIVKNRYPDFDFAIDETMNSKEGYFGNIFIANKAFFNDYCNWLFDILNKAEEVINVTKYDSYQKRIFGFLSERLFNIFLVYQKHNNPNFRLREVNSIFIKD